jgi:Mrp family chromosome partitioning ATPase
VKRALGALRKMTPNVIGAVLNAVDVKTKGYYGYEYYGSRKQRPEKGGRTSAGGRAHAEHEAPPAEVSDAPVD